MKAPAANEECDDDDAILKELGMVSHTHHVMSSVRGERIPPTVHRTLFISDKTQYN
jgi:hypothetical protein